MGAGFGVGAGTGLARHEFFGVVVHEPPRGAVHDWERPRLPELPPPLEELQDPEFAEHDLPSPVPVLHDPPFGPLALHEFPLVLPASATTGTATKAQMASRTVTRSAWG